MVTGDGPRELHYRMSSAPPSLSQPIPPAESPCHTPRTKSVTALPFRLRLLPLLAHALGCAPALKTEEQVQSVHLNY